MSKQTKPNEKKPNEKKPKETSENTSPNKNVFSAQKMQDTWEQMKREGKVPPLSEVLRIVREVAQEHETKRKTKS